MKHQIVGRNRSEEKTTTEIERTEQVGQEAVKGEPEKLVIVCPLIHTGARGQFLPLVSLCLTPRWKKTKLKIHVFTCCKCFPTAWMFTLIRPVSCVWPLMDLSLKHRHESTYFKRCSQHRHIFQCWIILLFVCYFWKTKDSFFQKLHSNNSQYRLKSYIW